MVELMCRDGKTSQSDLEKLADTIYYSTGIEVNVIAEQDRGLWCSGGRKM